MKWLSEVTVIHVELGSSSYKYKFRAALPLAILPQPCHYSSLTTVLPAPSSYYQFYSSLLLLPLLVFVVPFCPTVVTFYTTLDNLVTLQYQLLIPPFLLLSSSPTTTTNRLWLLLTSTPRHLPVPLIYSSSPSSMTRHPHPYSPYFSSPPYFLLPPATYPLQQLLVPVHRPYSFTLPPTPSSWLLQLPSSFYQLSFFDNYQLQYQCSDYKLYQLQHRHLVTLRQLS